MNKDLTFEEAIEQIKDQGEKERLNLEAAENAAELINAIVKERTSKGLTQRALAEITGIKQSTIARMETLQNNPRIDTIIKIANCLGLSIKAESVEIPTSSVSVIITFPGQKYSDYGWKRPLAYQAGFKSIAYGGA